MTPIEAAVKVAHNRCLDGRLRLSFKTDDARAIITAFLEAAAEDEETCRRVGFECGWEPLGPVEEGRNAILALKEAVG